MNRLNHQVRRATVDDLARLRALWEQAGFRAPELEKRLTEFQLIESAEGRLLGGIGLQIEARHGWLHHEAYADPQLERDLRPRLWERAQNVARNHGLARLWTVKEDAFLIERGFRAPDDAALKKLPPGFAQAGAAWLTLKLREENLESISLEQEFDLFKVAQAEWTGKAMSQARVLKALAWLLLMAAITGLVALGLRVFKNLPLSM